MFQKYNKNDQIHACLRDIMGQSYPIYVKLSHASF